MDRSLQLHNCRCRGQFHSEAASLEETEIPHTGPGGRHVNPAEADTHQVLERRGGGAVRPEFQNFRMH